MLKHEFELYQSFVMKQKKNTERDYFTNKENAFNWKNVTANRNFHCGSSYLRDKQLSMQTFELSLEHEHQLIELKVIVCKLFCDIKFIWK